MFKKILLIVIAVLLAAPVYATDIISLTAGNKWEYESVKLVRGSLKLQGKELALFEDVSAGLTVYEVLGYSQVGNDRIFDYVENTRLQSTSGTVTTEKTQIKLLEDKDSQKIISTNTETSGDDKPDVEQYNPALLYFVRNLKTNKSWDVGVLRDGEIVNPTSAKYAGKETITVPAGTFKDCQKIIYIADSASGTFEVFNMKMKVTGGQSRGIYWIADGVGVVKELVVSTSSSQGVGPDGKEIFLDASSCMINELKPGYVMKAID